MKKTILFLSALGILACKNEPKDYVLFTGKIIDKNSDSIVINNVCKARSPPYKIGIHFIIF